MSAKQPSYSSKILIVGSGVFGLSTALWLARSGYKDVTVFDMQDTHAAGYDPGRGIDSASADLNKIIRFSYGTAIAYQRLAAEAAGMWKTWNEELADTVAKDPNSVPTTLRDWRGEPRLFYNCGMCRMSATSEMPEYELSTLEGMEKEGVRHEQFRSDDDEDIERAREAGFEKRIDPLNRQTRQGVHKAVYDSAAGYAVAYRSCAWAQHLASKAGVKFNLGPSSGKVIAVDDTGGRPVVRTSDGALHSADLVVVAGGGWTPTLLPEASRSLETTAGSLLTIQLPDDRQDLWDRFSPENFPVCTLGMYDGVGIYMLPRTPEGILKIAYRGKKWTNFANIDNHHRVSVPKTAHVTHEKETNLPLEALDAMKGFIVQHLPELKGLVISSTKLCWYTDSIDDSFMVDRVPGKPGVMVCSGGSGHGFKFLPILGREVVKIIEKPEDSGVYRDLWRWRGDESSFEVGNRNGLEEGESGPRVLAKLKMASEKDWKIQWPLDSKL